MSRQPEDAPDVTNEAPGTSPVPAPDDRARPDGAQIKAYVVANARALAAYAALVAGVVFVMLGWWGAAHTNIFTEQIPYLISGGLLGLGLIIVAGILAAIAANERATREMRRDIAFLLQHMGGAVADGSAFAGEAAPSNGRVLVVTGGRSYHIAGCPIVEAKEGVRELQPAQAIASGLNACKLCGPD